MEELITEVEFLRRLHAQVHGIGNQKAAAVAWGVSESYLSDVMTGRRQPGPAICAAMGFKRVVMYATMAESDEKRENPSGLALVAIGERIRCERENRGWSLSRLAEESGVSRSHLHQVESGSSSPTYEVIAKLCAAFDVQPAELVDGRYFRA